MGALLLNKINMDLTCKKALTKIISLDKSKMINSNLDRHCKFNWYLNEE